jgi:tetratricopeptide (TPR) repeat protein
MMMGRYEDARAYGDRYIGLSPESPGGYMLKFNCAYLMGDLDGALISAEAIPNAPQFREFAIGFVLWLKRNYEECLAHYMKLTATPPSMIQLWYLPPELLVASVYREMGERELAAACLDSARVHLEKLVREHPDDARYRGSLGVTYAALGRPEDALREGTRAVELRPISRYAIRGVVRRVELARIYTYIGDIDLAVDELEFLLKTPGSYLSTATLRLNPQWDPLRGNPRFEKLIEQ